MTPDWALVAGKFIKANWKPIAGVVIVAGAWWAVTAWRDNLVKTADAAGFSRAEKQYAAAVDEANKREAQTQANFDKLFVQFGLVGAQREQSINLRIEPLTERIKNEVANDPRYRQCAVSDSVRQDLNSGRAAVDAGIAASNPGAAGPRP